MKDDNILIPIEETSITNLIYTIRGKQVMIDRDLADLYQVQTKRLNEQVKRNSARFPEEFCFRLSAEEKNELVANCDRFTTTKYSSSNPYAFTEQGVASNTEVKQKIFFDGQIYDAFSFIADLIGKAQSKLILIDNYVDVNTLNILCKKNSGADVLIATAGKGNLTTKDINKFNAQYPSLRIKTTTDFHDHFLIIDDKEGYFIGASIKDSGKKSFAITKIEDGKMVQDLINKVR